MRGHARFPQVTEAGRSLYANMADMTHSCGRPPGGGMSKNLFAQFKFWNLTHFMCQHSKYLFLKYSLLFMFISPTIGDLFSDNLQCLLMHRGQCGDALQEVWCQLSKKHLEVFQVKPGGLFCSVGPASCWRLKSHSTYRPFAFLINFQRLIAALL